MSDAVSLRNRAIVLMRAALALLDRAKRYPMKPPAQAGISDLLPILRW